MSSPMGIQVLQKERLFEMLSLKKRNATLDIKGLEWIIEKIKSGMSKEDVAYVEQLIAKNIEM